MKKKVYLIGFVIVVAVLTCALLAACGGKTGGNKPTPIDGENPGNPTQPIQAITPDFGDGVVSAPKELSLASLLADLGVNVASEKILESNCTSYTGLTQSAMESYMGQYIEEGWTSAGDGIFFKNSTVVAMTMDENNAFVIIEVQFSADVAQEVQNALTDEIENPEDPAELSSISVNSDNAKKKYFIGESLDTEGLSISEHMSDSTNQTGSLGDYTVDSENAFNSNVAGTYVIRVTNKEDSSIYDEYQVTVSLRVMENVTCNDVHTEFDGESHSITVLNAPEGAIITYSLDTEEPKVYTSENPSYVLPTEVTVSYKVSKAGYADYTSSALIDIYKATFEYGAIALSSGEYDYDGEEHSISIMSMPEGVTVVFSTDSGADKTYVATNPVFTDAGKYTVYYKVTKEGYADHVDSKTVTINKVDIEGISAQSFIGIAGTDASITVLGTEDGDVIEYCEPIQDTTDSYTTTNIVKNTECNVTIKYRVTRGANYEHTGSATITLVRNEILTGITFNGVTEDWNENLTQSLSANDIDGYLNGDVIYFSTDGESNWKEDYSVGYTEPGTYPIYLKLLRVGAGYYTASANIVIQKLDYTSGSAPFSGPYYIDWNEGMTLATIAEFFDFEEDEIIISNPDTVITAKTYDNVEAIFNRDPVHYNNYKMSLTIVVSPKSIPNGDVSVSGVEVVYDGQPHGATVSGSNTSAYTISYRAKNDTTWASSLTYTNVKKDAGGVLFYEIEWQIERDNYETETGFAVIKINQATYAVGVITHENVTVNYTDGMDYESIESHLDEDFAWAASSYTKVYATGSEGVDTDIIYTGNDNYLPYTLTIKLIVNPATITGITAAAYEGTYNPSGSYGHLYGVQGIKEGDTVMYSLSNDPYNWKSRIDITSSDSLKNAGVYTVYYKVERANYTDLIGSQTVTVKKLAQTFSVNAPEELGYNAQNKVVTITTSGNLNADKYTLLYSDTPTGVYTATAPDCKLIGEYSFYVKPSSNNYSFTDSANPDNDYALATFEVVKGTFVWEDSLSHSSILDNIEGIAAEDESYSFDVSPIVTALAAKDITDAADYSIAYSTDNKLTYSTVAPTFTTACEAKKVYIKLSTSLYEDVEYIRYVTLVAIADVNGIVNDATADCSDVTGMLGSDAIYDVYYSFDDKAKWIAGDWENNYCYTFTSPCENEKVYYKVITYVENPEYTNPEDPNDHYEPAKTYTYFFYATVTAEA